MLADLVEGLGGPRRPAVAALRTSHRFGESDRRAGRGGARRRRRRGARAARRPAASTSSSSSDADPTARAARGAGAARAGPGPRRPSAATRTRPWRRSTGTGCCARTARARTASPLEPPGRALARRGDRASRSGAAWYAGRPLLVTANDYGLGLYNGDTGVVVRRRRRRAARGRRGRPPAARPRDQPARRGRDHARDDDPQEPGQPGRRGHRAAARRGLAAADPRALLHRGHPRPATGWSWSEARRRPGRRRPPGAAGDRAAAAPGRADHVPSP